MFVRSLTDADENHNVIPEDLSNYKVARAGNLVINKMKAWQGSMGIAPVTGSSAPRTSYSTSASQTVPLVKYFCVADPMSHTLGRRLTVFELVSGI